MSQQALKHIKDKLLNGGINYEFGEWNSDIVYPYFVGEYNEQPPNEEDGSIESAFILNGFTTGKWLDLEEAKETIEKLFTFDTSILENGSGLTVSYNGSLVIPTGDANLKRIQVNLSIKEWRV